MRVSSVAKESALLVLLQLFNRAGLADVLDIGIL